MESSPGQHGPGGGSHGHEWGMCTVHLFFCKVYNIVFVVSVFLPSSFPGFCVNLQKRKDREEVGLNVYCECVTLFYSLVRFILFSLLLFVSLCWYVYVQQIEQTSTFSSFLSFLLCVYLVLFSFFLFCCFIIYVFFLLYLCFIICVICYLCYSVFLSVMLFTLSLCYLCYFVFLSLFMLSLFMSSLSLCFLITFLCYLCLLSLCYVFVISFYVIFVT